MARPKSEDKKQALLELLNNNSEKVNEEENLELEIIETKIHSSNLKLHTSNIKSRTNLKFHISNLKCEI